jgi:hypothetical protein
MEQIMKNVIIDDGTNTFKYEDVLRDKKLFNLVYKRHVFGGLSTLIEKLDRENAQLYIVASKDHLTSIRHELRGVSTELLNEIESLAK